MVIFKSESKNYRHNKFKFYNLSKIQILMTTDDDIDDERTLIGSILSEET